MTLGPVKGSVVTQVGETVYSATTLLLENFNKLIIYFSKMLDGGKSSG